jgi:hypothetical protein
MRLDDVRREAEGFQIVVTGLSPSGITPFSGLTGPSGRGRQFSGSSPRREALGRGSCGPGLP